MALPLFAGTPSDSDYDFLLECDDRLCNLSIRELHGVGYIHTSSPALPRVVKVRGSSPTYWISSYDLGTIHQDIFGVILALQPLI